MKIALLEPLGIGEEMMRALAQPLIDAGHEFVYYDAKTTDVEELKRRSAGCEIVVIANNPYPGEVVCGADALKMLDVAFTGIDHVGLEACRERGVLVCNAANYSNQTVAELVIGLVIDLYRKILPGDAAVRAGGASAGLMGREICGKTVGIVGTGRIGTITANLFRAFGAKVVAYSRTRKPELEAQGVEYMLLDELMRESDIISLHVPNNASTRRMIGREQIALMKPTAILVNCARGPVLDAAALADALNEGRIAGAGIDVFDCEPPIPESDPLRSARNTVLTPHVAFLSEESMVRRAHIVFDNIWAYLKGAPENVCKL